MTEELHDLEEIKERLDGAGLSELDFFKFFAPSPMLKPACEEPTCQAMCYNCEKGCYNGPSA
ncbi:MAG: hypothetical protein HXS48_23185 [Theionarchaea archaeon]|nr:MAG: hypothetical protein AYK19_20750 [Theionarchaea archaeon DG-70-1]MBU7029858.1 hypothetical protein [Theionarchaea archaeon]